MVRLRSSSLRFLLLTLCSVAAIGAFVVATIPASAAVAQLGFSPASASVATGSNVNVNITVGSVTNLGGYDVSLQFNPALVRLTSLTDAGFVTSGGNIVACNPATINNTAGTGTLSCATVSPFGSPGPGVSSVSPTPLVRAAFSGVAAGSSPLTLTGSALQDPTGAPIVSTLGTGTVQVSAATLGGLDVDPGHGSPLMPFGSTGPGMTWQLPWIAAAVGLILLIVAGARWRIRERSN